MKKILIAIITGILPAMIIVSYLNAQVYTSDKTFTNKATMRHFTTAMDTVVSSNNTAKIANSNAEGSKAAKKDAKDLKQFDRTVRAFEKEFKTASVVKWAKVTEGYVGCFTENDITNRVWYSKGGNLLYIMRTYDEKNLPGDVRRTVKSTYYDYKITGVDEVHQDDTIVYVVHLEDEHTIKLVTVCNGEMNIYQQLVKSK